MSTTENWKVEEVNGSFQGFDYGLLVPISSKTPVADSGEIFMPIWVKILWTITFLVMILVASGGNCIVIWIVIAHRRMRTVTNYFLVNLSLADLLLTTFNCIFNFSYMIQRDWPFGSLYCIVSNFIANATVAASVFTLTGISCDRYLAIVHPLKPRMSKRSSLITITFIWLASMTVAFPCLLYSTTITNKYKGKERTGCILIWPDGKVVGSHFDFAYQMFFLIITYVIPVTLMSFSYTIMGKELWGSRSIGEMTQRQIDSIRSKRKVVKMFIFVVFIFAICWLPYHGYFLYVYYDTEIIFSKYTQHVYLAFYWFAMSNAMVNPLIYYWMNARFRQYFKTAICGWKECILHKKCKGDDSSLNTEFRQSHSGFYRSRKSKREEKLGVDSPNNVASPTTKTHEFDESFKRDKAKNTQRWVRTSFRNDSKRTTVNL
ncbi:tachykinin-like peptides receptor 86C isoform X1 [Tribolium madens]|uniref:tachykinin-like peptides receptor 86C isoform X1 n=1 Tax=Tribolium madens TaxID=41895 RepID=UPI001CF72271|nr:tachykinin-like peptides receptor 86C isoform X1 [Tribolium madens]